MASPEVFEYALEALLGGLLIVSAATDALYGKIHNALTYPAAGIGLVLHTIVAGRLGFEASALGFGIGFLPFFILFAMGLLNGGDVKLLAAIGALGGYPFILHAIFLSFLVAAAMALLRLLWAGELFATLRMTTRNVLRAALPGVPLERPAIVRTIPFGLAALVGSSWAMFVLGGLSIAVAPS